MPAALTAALRGALVLGGLMAVAGLGLALVNAGTATRIEENRRAARQAVLRELTGLDVEMATHQNVVACEQGLVALAMVERGYGGAMDVVAAFRNGRLVGVRVPRHTETPGFADILAPADWIGGLGAAAGGTALGGADIDAVTGATITSRAVLRARAAAIDRYGEAAPWCER